MIELPGDSTPEQRKACADALVRHWESRGHPACAAVHGNGKVQPHVHVQATARPVSDDGTVDRSVLLWTSKQELRDEREAVAGIVNRYCPSKVRFHGGRHDDVHIDREARKEAGLLQRRLPRRAQYRPDKYEFDDGMPGRVKEMHECGRAWARTEADGKKAEQEREAAAREALRAAREAAGENGKRNREIRKEARERRNAEQAELRELTEKQTKWLEDAHRDAGRELPDLDDEEGRRDAWAFARERAERKQTEAREKEATAEAAGRSQAEAEAAEQRTLDELRTQWTRERQARRKYAGEMAKWEGRRWTSEASMIDSLKRAFEPEHELQQSLESVFTDADGPRYLAETIAAQDVLCEFVGRHGVEFGHGASEPAWRLERETFLEQARTVAQDGNGDRVHVAFPRVAGAPELVRDRDRRRWDYRHPDPEQSHRTGKAVDWEDAAGMAHHASVRDALKRGDPVPAKTLADYPDLREERAKALRKEYRRAGLTLGNAIRDSKSARATGEFREEAAGRLERTQARIAEMREEAKALGIELEPRRRQDRSRGRGGGIGD